MTSSAQLTQEQKQSYINEILLTPSNQILETRFDSTNEVSVEAGCSGSCQSGGKCMGSLSND